MNTRKSFLELGGASQNGELFGSVVEQIILLLNIIELVASLLALEAMEAIKAA